MKDDILMIAAVCRRACEQYAEVHGLFYPELGGMCGMASHLLFNELSERGYKPKFIKVDGPRFHGSHCWVAVDNLHIDITATQFKTCCPVYSFNGIIRDHPILRDIYQAPALKFPETWQAFVGHSESDIHVLLDSWPNESLYSMQRKHLDNFL